MFKTHTENNNRKLKSITDDIFYIIQKINPDSILNK